MSVCARVHVRVCVCAFVRAIRKNVCNRRPGQKVVFEARQLKSLLPSSIVCLCLLFISPRVPVLPFLCVFVFVFAFVFVCACVCVCLFVCVCACMCVCVCVRERERERESERNSLWVLDKEFEI